MNRRPDLNALTLLGLLAALAVLMLALLQRESAAAAPFPTRVQAISEEFRLSLSRVVVRGGPVRIELVNFGEDLHDLRLRRIGGTNVYKIPETAPGERAAKTFRLVRGRYRVWCTVAGHRGWGMRATLRVVPRR